MDGKKGSKVLEHPLWHSRPSLMLFKNFWFFWELELFRNIFYDFFFLDEVSIHKKISKNLFFPKKTFHGYWKKFSWSLSKFYKIFPSISEKINFFLKFYLEKFWFYSIKQIQVFFIRKHLFPKLIGSRRFHISGIFNFSFQSQKS